MSGLVYALNLLNLANLHPQREKGASDHLRHLFDKPLITCGASSSPSRRLRRRFSGAVPEPSHLLEFLV